MTIVKKSAIIAANVLLAILLLAWCLTFGLLYSGWEATKGPKDSGLKVLAVVIVTTWVLLGWLCHYPSGAIAVTAYLLIGSIGSEILRYFTDRNDPKAKVNDARGRRWNASDRHTGSWLGPWHP